MAIVVFSHASQGHKKSFDAKDGFAAVVAAFKASCEDWPEYELFEGYEPEWFGEWYRARCSVPIPNASRSSPYGYSRATVRPAPPCKPYNGMTEGNLPPDFSRRPPIVRPRPKLRPPAQYAAPDWGNDDGDLFDHLDPETRWMLKEAIAVSDFAIEETFYG